jgi:aldehyde dehydrogenase
MTQMNEQMLRQVVQTVLAQVKSGWGGRAAPTPGHGAPPPISSAPATSSTPAAGSRFGQFTKVDDAVEAATTAQRALMKRSLRQRDQAVAAIRRVVIDGAEELGRLEYEETQIGHPPHKAEKLIAAGNVAQGVRGLRTDCFSGDHGITLDERGPWGVIGAVTPVTHSLPTLAVNAMDMITAGNAAVFNPHPGGKRIAAHGARLINQAIHDKLGIDNLVCVITEPTLETAGEIFSHPGIGMLAITGGPGVVAAALKSGKRAVCAGPGNPPVVVDASADLANAARCIIDGASYDNNLLCLSEKEVFVVAEAFDAMMDAMAGAGAHRLSERQMDDLARVCIQQPKGGGMPHANKKFVGAEPQAIARELGLSIPADCRLLYGPAAATHPFVQAEQMMPVLPFVRCESFEQAVDAARQAEHGFRHTAIIHSRLVDHMTYMGREMNTTIYVKNGPSVAGNGAGGEGYGNYSIACTTGEGIVTPITFTRFRRCCMVDNLRIV